MHSTTNKPDKDDAAQDTESEGAMVRSHTPFHPV